MNWLGADPAADVYGSALVRAGIPTDVLREWSADPSVQFGGEARSLFDLHEDLDVGACTAKALAVHAATR